MEDMSGMFALSTYSFLPHASNRDIINLRTVQGMSENSSYIIALMLNSWYVKADLDITNVVKCMVLYVR